MSLVDAVMCGLAQRRPVFHGEADFQHAFAQELTHATTDAQVRLEYRPWPGERRYLDVWATADGAQLAVELKYLTRPLRVDVDGEAFTLTNQAAQDIRRYDFWRDVVRLERLVAYHPRLQAHAVCLTNDPGYWRPPRSADSVDAAFRLHEGREVSGRLAWSDAAGEGTTRGRTAPLELTGGYTLRWRDFAAVAGQNLRYLHVEMRSPAPERGAGEGS